MAAFDIPALTRGISGLFIAKEEGKRAAEDRAREQQSRAVDDLFRRQSAQSLAERGRIARERLALQKQQAEERKAQREEVETQTASRNAADEDEILGQLDKPFDRTGKSHLFVMREARRRITEQNRVPRGQGGQLSVRSAFEILKDRYAKFEDDGTGKLVFTGFEKPEAEILAEARELARGGAMTPRPPQPEVVEEEKGPGFFKKLGDFSQKLGQTIVPGGERGFLPPRSETPSREDTQRRARELEAEGIPRDEIRQIMQSEGFRVQ
ncbi:hypothetical protein LCGC14_1752740 [marine sediment metagenome]|uniref:Uncharacterized protein n=1 Tax=marine sediment metagenome TaxID=412755 RepID=A0A0F9H3C5_9ZZZZ